MQQRRWVTYIYRYRDGEKCEIAGFVKVQRITNHQHDMARIRMGLKMYKGYPCGCTAYLIKGGVAYPFTYIHFAARERDTLLNSVELPWLSPLCSEVTFPEYEGVYFRCDDGEELAGVWDENAFHMGEISIWQQEDELLQIGDDVETDIGDELLQIGESEGVAEIAADDRTVSCQEFLRTYPKLPLFAGSQILDGVKIVPQDIGKLPLENWKLGVNSFLSHGYYKYRYLMLGKVRLNHGESYVIGVPGVFTNKEKYLANMFGFRVFVPVKKTKINTGNFGYWVYELNQERVSH